MRSALYFIALLTSLAAAAVGQTIHPEATLETLVAIDSAITCEQGAQIVGVGHDGAIYAWTLPSPTPRKITVADGPVQAVTCAGGKTLAAWRKGGIVVLLDLNSGQERLRINPGGRLWGFALSPDGSLIAVASNIGPSQLWNTHTGQKISTGVMKIGSSNSAAFSPNGEMFVSADTDTSARAYDRDGKLLYTADAGLLELFAAAFTGDSKYFTVASADGTVRLFDAASGKNLKTSSSSGNPIHVLAMSPDSQRVMALELDDFTDRPVAIGLWDMHSDAIQPLAINAADVIGLGTNQSHLLLIKQEAPKTVTVYSLQ
jgi:WD40 repeat protein